MKCGLRFTIRLILVLATLVSISSCKSHKDLQENNGLTYADDYWNSDVKGKNPLLYRTIGEWMGTPYKYGGHSKQGTDCSGFVMEVYKTVYHKDLERNSAKMFQKNCKEISKGSLREGDLVFFKTGKSSRISHVGLYLESGRFVHASSSRGVIVSNLAERYYEKHDYASGRVK